MASMEHPIFSLSVKPDMRELDYRHDGKRIMVVPSGKGLATIMDKDILLYCISKLVHQLNAGDEISPWVELTAHEVMVATNWRTNRESYQRFEDALDRLRGTTIKTDIPTGEHRQTRGFGLIDAYEITRRDEDGEESAFGRMTRVRVKISDWTFRAVQGMEVLTINPHYFRLRRPLERRIYELARKHVGDQGRPFRIGLDKLQKKVGSNSPEKKFKFFLKQIAQDGHIPDYDIEIDGANVVFNAKRAGFSRGQIEMALGIPATPSPALIDKARRAAPGFDVYMLYEEWRGFASAQKEPPRNFDAAFLGFCKKRAKQE
ncbi:Replication initiator protein A [Maliponia aquimaris]|uniref:Replication initiator protein A n=2 Tax=Maliponia aquimaris TaxID=1673631 RepID=A0A238JUA6_9RHOB|nr:Replication initiator protein A [Maliponia aquimaris]